MESSLISEGRESPTAGILRRVQGSEQVGYGVKPTLGGVAQMGEQGLCTAQVAGSTPVASTKTGILQRSNCKSDDTGT